MVNWWKKLNSPIPEKWRKRRDKFLLAMNCLIIMAFSAFAYLFGRATYAGLGLSGDITSHGYWGCGFITGVVVGCVYWMVYLGLADLIRWVRMKRKVHKDCDVVPREVKG